MIVDIKQNVAPKLIAASPAIRIESGRLQHQNA